MRYTYRRGILWLLIYFLLALVPLGIALVGNPPAVREFWIELGVAFGFIGLAMMGLQSVFSGRFQKIAPTYGGDNIIQFHKEIGLVSFFFVLAHPVTLIIANNDYLSYYNPTVNFLRAIALSVVSVFLIAIIVTSLWRITFGLSYEKWRLVHGFLALSIVFIGIVHSIQVAHYLDPLWKKIAIAATMAITMYLVIHTRIIRPWKNKKRPYKIKEVVKERGSSYSIILKPQGHQKLEYIPGQFCWITINETPFSLQQHPFSFSSSARNSNIILTAKELGDFTSTWKVIKPGSTAFLEGPFGSFTPKPDSHLFMIMGGIGVTPAMGMLRTMRDDKDKRKAILIYGNEDWENITFREELGDIQKEIDLQVVHVLSDADENWEGEKGYVDKDLINRYLAENKNDYMYFICGPGPLMDIAEIALHDLGIDWRRIYSERFEMV
jgi:predicted ferric reductase